MVDILSALNAGSGINTKQLIEGLVQAERAPKELQLQTRAEVVDARISGVGAISSAVRGFEAALSALGDPSSFYRDLKSSAPNNIDVAVTDTSKVRPFSSDIVVSQLAGRQTLEFSGFTSDTAAVGTGTITLQVGTWTFAQDGTASFAEAETGAGKTVTIDSSNDSLAGLRDNINELGIGVTASIVKKDDDSYSLVLKSSDGAGSALRVTRAGSVSANIGFDPAATDSTDMARQLTEAKDAHLTVDGVAITRPRNVITDVIDGVKLSLGAADAAKTVQVGASVSDHRLREAAKLVVNAYNGLITTVTELTRRDASTGAVGPLNGHSAIRGLINTLRSFTTQPLAGAEGGPFALAHIGIKTQRDGTLEFDSRVFERMLRDQREAVEGVLISRKTVLDVRFEVSSVTKVTKPGLYALDKDGSTWTLGGRPATVSGDKISAAAGSAAEGLVVAVPGGVAALPSTVTTKVSFQISIVERMRTMASDALKATSALGRLQESAQDELEQIAEEYEQLNKRMEVVEQRYKTQFLAMELAIDQMNTSRSAIDQFVNIWTNSLQRR